MRIVILGLSITSSWGNGHATTYRALLRELARRGHDLLFLERDVPWYSSNRDLPDPPFCRLELYGCLRELRDRHSSAVRRADAVVVGSYVPEGVEVGEWVQETARGTRAFYDIDTPLTVAGLERGDREYLAPEQIPRYDLYLSFTGGPILETLVRRFGSPCARPLYCAVDPELYRPEPAETRWDLGYLGTYCADRQPLLERLLLEPARRSPRLRFAVAGPQYPESIRWPENVERFPHVPPPAHRGFYNRQRFTLNLTRAAMARAGYSPSVRLFEAAACGAAIVSDTWAGIELFLEPGREILLIRDAEDTARCLGGLREEERRAVGLRARERVLRDHTASHRAAELEGYLREVARGVLPALASCPASPA